MSSEIRRKIIHVEETLIEGGKEAARPLKLIAAVAIIRNPWFGRGFVDDLKPEICAISPEVGEVLAGMVVNAAGSGEQVEAYGKCAIVGMGGEIEHASALIHHVLFGNQYRKHVGAKSYLSFNNTRCGPGAPILIPLMDKRDSGRRSHYLTIQLAIPDAPAEDEIIIALGGSTGGRPHHRIGDRYQDLAELGLDPENPAAI